MSDQTQNPSATPAPVEASSPSPACQPLTFSGVAAFARTGWWKLLLVQTVVASFAAASVVWIVAHRYSPVITKFIRQLPAGACITNGQLTGISGVPISETRFLSLAVASDELTDLDQSADVQIALRKRHLEISSPLSSAFGSLEFNYGPNANLDLSRDHLEPWWGAWQQVTFAGVGIGVVISLFLVWSILAALYAPAAMLTAWFGDRRLSLPEAWKLSSAALIPGALLLTFGILLYGAQSVDIIGLGYFEAVHFVVGWVYVLGAALRAPQIVSAPIRGNPFVS